MVLLGNDVLPRRHLRVGLLDQRVLNPSTQLAVGCEVLAHVVKVGHATRAWHPMQPYCENSFCPSDDLPSGIPLGCTTRLRSLGTVLRYA